MECWLGWLELAGDPNELHPRIRPTQKGEAALKRRGIKVEQNRRPGSKLAYGCTDWTERRFHLGGALDSAVTDALNGQGFIRRRKGSRVVAVGQPILDWLGQMTVSNRPLSFRRSKATEESKFCAGRVLKISCTVTSKQMASGAGPQGL